MKRKFALFILVATVITIGLLGFQITKELAEQADVKERISILPSLDSFIPVIHEPGELPAQVPNRAVVIVHFNTKCPRCLDELDDILNHPRLIASTTILLISPLQKSELYQLAERYRLEEYPGIYVLRYEGTTFYKSFGTKVFPAAFIYNQKKQYITRFLGQVRAEAIYNSIISD